MFKCVLDEAEQILEDVRYAFGEAKMREDLSLKLNEHIKSCENALTNFRTMLDTPEVMEAMIKDKPDKRGDTLLERMAIKRAELAAQVAEEGHVGASLSYIKDAYEVLSKLGDCEEKDSVISFLKQLEDNL